MRYLCLIAIASMSGGLLHAAHASDPRPTGFGAAPAPAPLVPAPPAPAPPAAGSADPTVERRLAELDAKIAALESRGPASRAGASSGAYARGTSLRVEGDGSREPILERLRRLERELAGANATIAAKERTATELVRQRDQAVGSSRSAGEKADYLAHVRDQLMAAQQALAERQERIDALNAQLGTSELQRLRAERRWYQFAGDLLRLSSEDPRELPELQMRVRDATREVRDPTATASNPAATGASAPVPAHAPGGH